MHLDLRYPIGLLLTAYGVILALQGALVGTTVLGLNVNLYWGAVMLVCGLGAIVLASRGPSRENSRRGSRARARA